MNNNRQIFVFLSVLSCTNKFNYREYKNSDKGGDIISIQSNLSLPLTQTLNVSRRSDEWNPFPELTKEDFILNMKNLNPYSTGSGTAYPATIYMGDNKKCLSFYKSSTIYARCTNFDNIIVPTFSISSISSSYGYNGYTFTKFIDEERSSKYLSIIRYDSGSSKLSIHELSEFGIVKILDNKYISGIFYGKNRIFIMEGGKYISLIIAVSSSYYIRNYKIDQNPANPSITQVGSSYTIPSNPLRLAFFEKDNLAIIVYTPYINSEYSILYDIVKTSGESKQISSKISTNRATGQTLGNQRYSVFDYDLNNDVFIVFYSQNRNDDNSGDGVFAALTKLDKNSETGDITNKLTETKVSDDVIGQFYSLTSYSFYPNEIKYISELDIWFLSYSVRASSSSSSPFNYYARFYKRNRDNNNLVPLTESIKFDTIYPVTIYGEDTNSEYIPIDKNRGKILLTYCESRGSEIKFKEFNIEIKKTFTSTTIKVTTTTNPTIPKDTSTTVESNEISNTPKTIKSKNDSQKSNSSIITGATIGTIGSFAALLTAAKCYLRKKNHQTVNIEPSTVAMSNNPIFTGQDNAQGQRPYTYDEVDNESRSQSFTSISGLDVPMESNDYSTPLPPPRIIPRTNRSESHTDALGEATYDIASDSLVRSNSRIEPNILIDGSRVTIKQDDNGYLVSNQEEKILPTYSVVDKSKKISRKSTPYSSLGDGHQQYE